MLTPQESQELAAGGYSQAHDAPVCSLVWGEPYLEGGVLSYYDGRVVTICGFPLRGAPEFDQRALRRLVCRWITSHDVDGVFVMSPEPAKLKNLAACGFRRKYWKKRNELTAELAIDCSSESADVLQSKVYKRTLTDRFQSRVRRGGAISADNYRLIEDFFAKRELSQYLADWVVAFPALLSSPRISILEAYQGDELQGLLLFNKLFAEDVVAHFLVRKRGVNGVSDYLFGRLLEAAIDLGAKRVNVGSSGTPGQYAFKRKWQASEYVPPGHEAEWCRRALRKRSMTSWGPRLLGLK